MLLNSLMMLFSSSKLYSYSSQLKDLILDIISSVEAVENGHTKSSSRTFEPNLKGTPSIALVPSKLSDLKDVSQTEEERRGAT